MKFLKSIHRMVTTKLVKINPKDITFNDSGEPIYKHGDFPKEFMDACSILNKGEGIIGIPTETVYGLGANALNVDSISKIYKAKGRPSDNPLIVHVSSLEMLNKIIPNGIPSIYEPVINRFWPGALTILVPTSDIIPKQITANQLTVAIRFPSHPVARAIISKSDVPIAAPSANLSGKPSPTLAQHVMDDLNGKIEYIIDAGPCDLGLESTVLDGLSVPPILLRPGSVTVEQIREIKGFEQARVYRKESFSKEEQSKIEDTPTTPGMKYTHYSPKAKVILLEKRHEENLEESIKIQLEKIKHRDDKINVAVLTKEEIELNNSYSKLNIHYEKIGEQNDDELLAKNMFAKLREMDSLNMNIIIIQGVQDHHLGTAVMNRLRKAASEIVEY